MISAIQAEAMNMSIWLRSDGLSFAVFPKSDAEQAPPIEEGHISFESKLSLRENIENSLYQEALLGLPYARVHLHYTPSAVGLTPLALYDYEQREVWETTICRSREEVLLPHKSREEEGTLLLGAWERSVVEFLERTYLMIDFIPSYAHRLEDLRSACQREGGSRLLLWLTRQGITLAHSDAQGLHYINVFNFVRPSDSSTFVGEMMYYISLVWQTLHLDDSCTLVLEGEQSGASEAYAEQSAIIEALRSELEGRITNI